MKNTVVYIMMTTAIYTLSGCSDHHATPVKDIAAAQVNNDEKILYSSYCNERFGFCVDYPPELLIPQGESDSGDGQIFMSKDGENILRAYRDFRDNINPDTAYSIQATYEEDSGGQDDDKSGRTITYKKLGKHFFVISGRHNNKIFYQKTLFSNGQLVTCLLEYNERDKVLFDKISERIFNSLQ